MHAWDFARATGQEITISDVVTDYVEELAQQTIARSTSLRDIALIIRSAMSSTPAVYCLFCKRRP